MWRRMAMLGLIVAGPARAQAPAPPEAKGASSVALEVLAELQAAHEARVEESRLLRDGRADVLSLEGRTAVVELETIVAEQRREAARTALAQLEARQAPLGRREAQVAGLMVEVAAQIHSRLDALAARVPPGAVPPRATPEPRAAEARLDAAFDRLEEAERRARQIEITLAEGDLEGERRAVQILRVGAAAAWWLSLDGDQAGWVEVREGSLALRPLADPVGREAIARAVRIAKGRAAPDLIPLPLPEAGS
ncbi:MAG: DUF3450 family protein [Myxococcota bacterium]